MDSLSQSIRLEKYFKRRMALMKSIMETYKEGKKVVDKDGVEFWEVVRENGCVWRIPILSDEEREERRQDFLRLADRLLEKYKDLIEEKHL